MFDYALSKQKDYLMHNCQHNNDKDNRQLVQFEIMQNNDWLIDFHIIEKEDKKLALQQKYDSLHCLDAKLNDIKALKHKYYNINFIQNVLSNKSSYNVLKEAFNKINVMKSNVNEENVLYTADFGRIFHITEAD